MFQNVCTSRMGLVAQRRPFDLPPLLQGMAQAYQPISSGCIRKGLDKNGGHHHSQA